MLSKKTQTMAINKKQIGRPGKGVKTAEKLLKDLKKQEMERRRKIKIAREDINRWTSKYLTIG